MGRFLRILLLIVLALIGFGTGICGLFGLGVTTFAPTRGADGLVVGLSVVGLLIAVGCFFAIRALVRRLRGRTGAPAPPADEPPSPGAGR